jgi:hypothetical protein
MTMALNDAAKYPDAAGNPDKALLSLPVGATVQLNYGKANTLLLFMGYETVKEARATDTGNVDAAGNPIFEERGLRGRFTFVRTW